MSITKRSLKASSTGIHLAKKAFARKGWTQENLASEVNLKTRQPIWRFFTGRPIERHTFVEICSLLELNWLEIAQDPPAEVLEKICDNPEKIGNTDINVLVQQARSKRYDKIQHRCGYLTLLDVHYPVNINDIYVDVDILEQIGTHTGIEIAQLQNWTPEEFERFSLNNSIVPKKMSGIQAVETYSKLRILGQPGVGKTVFLQHLALLCNQGQFCPNRVPIFINLRDFAEESRQARNFSLFNFIHGEFITTEITNPTILINLLHGGRILLLLDGLDEVNVQDFPNVIQELRRFSEKYYNNLFVVGCRTAAKEFKIKGFTDVEIAPLTEEKITQFVEKWLVEFRKLDLNDGLKQAVKFNESLNLPENLQFRQLAVRPLFLYIACLMFSRSEDFFLKFNNFSKVCLDSLLGKWDQSKSIKRDEIYPEFSLVQKLKLFRQLATDSFEEGKYFFHKKQIQQYISGYLHNLPNDLIDLEQLQVDSEAVLKAIELQHGILIERLPDIFSFSFSGFQDYFTAQQIADKYNLQKSERSLQNLVNRIKEPRWHKIFLLTASELENADFLIDLIKQKIDNLVSKDPEIKAFLSSVPQQFQAGNTLKIQGAISQQIRDNFNHFTPQQQQTLECYYQANQLLFDCLKSTCKVTESVRQEIKAFWLLSA
ncbi:NACHT domain-containing protein [Capilliphycus salinus ALCB114379]|uniref:NACHT domain-containing protein n=1 Tax=Capilliphycus salinus TaxID=2768948 RepID=UPI0039A4A2F2